MNILIEMLVNIIDTGLYMMGIAFLFTIGVSIVTIATKGTGGLNIISLTMRYLSGIACSGLFVIILMMFTFLKVFTSTFRISVLFMLGNSYKSILSRYAGMLHSVMDYDNFRLDGEIPFDDDVEPQEEFENVEAEVEEFADEED